MNALMGGEADFSITDPVASINAAKSGKVRLIAVTSAQRAKAFPQLRRSPSPGCRVTSSATWGGLLAPAGTPARIVAKLNADARARFAESDVVAEVRSIGLEIRPGSPDDFAQVIRADSDKWASSSRNAISSSGSSHAVPVRSSRSRFRAEPVSDVQGDARPSSAYRMEETGFWLVTRYEDVSRALGDPASFSSSRGNTTVDTPVRIGKTLGTIDPPRHDETAADCAQGLYPRAHRRGAAPSARACEAPARRFPPSRRGDLVADLGRPLLYGPWAGCSVFDEEAAHQGSELMTGLFHPTDGPMGSPLPGTMAPDIRAFLDAELRKRKSSRGDDLSPC